MVLSGTENVETLRNNEAVGPHVTPCHHHHLIRFPLALPKMALLHSRFSPGAYRLARILPTGPGQRH